MNKYFKVPLDAAKALCEASQGPELLAAYMAPCRWACGTDYGYTAAGARAIKNATGVSDFRSKLLLTELLSLRFGERGEKYLIAPTGKMIRNAREYKLGEWDGPVAYVPDMMIQPDASPLLRLMKAEELPEVRRDALMMLLYVYAYADYGEFMGVSPDEFAYTKWTGEGSVIVGDAVLELGFQERIGNLDFWLMAEATDEVRYTFQHVAERIYTPGDDAIARFWAAHDLLLSIGMICRVSMVEFGTEPFPLWVFSPAYREALTGSGVAGDLAQAMYRAADMNALDPDNLIIQHAVSDEVGALGTGVFFCASTNGEMPVVRTVYAPLFHAPTPLNLEGLELMGERTDAWSNRLRLESRRAA